MHPFRHRPPHRAVITAAAMAAALPLLSSAVRAEEEAPAESLAARILPNAPMGGLAGTALHRWIVNAPSSFDGQPVPVDEAAVHALASAAGHFRLSPAPEPEPEPVIADAVPRWHATASGLSVSYVPRSQAYSWGAAARAGGFRPTLWGWGPLTVAPGLTGGGVRHISVAYSASRFVESALREEQWRFSRFWGW